MESENQDIVLYDPKGEIARGGSAADALLAVVRKAGLARKFGGQKEHLFYEAWQVLAKFHRCTVKTRDAILVEIDGVKGAKAYADLIDDITGVIVGGAEAYCMRDEMNWKNKPWFQLASMAQTRAGSKACRNKWAYIPALVGFATTPAEEMDEVHVQPVVIKKPEPIQPISTPPDIKEKLMEICNGDPKEICDFIESVCGKGKRSLKSLTPEEMVGLENRVNVYLENRNAKD